MQKWGPNIKRKREARANKTLDREFEKVKHQFSGSPVLKADLGEIDRRMRETDAAIDQRLFQKYGLSEDEIALIEAETVPLSDYS
jgi:hypothetical protein